MSFPLPHHGRTLASMRDLPLIGKEASCGLPDDSPKDLGQETGHFPRVSLVIPIKTLFLILFGLSSRRDCRVSPPDQELTHPGLVSVALPLIPLASPHYYVSGIRLIHTI